MRALRTLLPALVLLAGLLAGAREADRVERWYEVKVAGNPAGWTRSLETRVPEGWRTESETRLRLKRGSTLLDMSTTGWMVESADGKPLSGGRTQAGSGASQRVTWRYTPEGVIERTTDGDRVTERTLPSPPADALPPHAADAEATPLRASTATEIVQRIFEPAQGALPQRVRAVRAGPERISVAGTPVDAMRWKLEGPLVPPDTLEWRGADGALLRSLSPTGLGAIESVLSTRERAKVAFERAGDAPEVMVASFAECDRPMADPLRLRQAVLRVRSKSGTPEAPLSAGYQRVRALDGGGFEVTVDLDQPPAAATDAERADPAYLASSPMIDARDDEIAAFAREAVADAPAVASARLERLRAATYARLSRKNLASALASASDAFRSRSGDCTEHAVLLAALLRAQRIPARVVAGLVWCDDFGGRHDVFGWHLWTQALVGGRWVDLDATLPPGGPGFHPGHIALAATALSDPAGDPSWTRLLGALGNLRIEVVHGAR